MTEESLLSPEVAEALATIELAYESGDPDACTNTPAALALITRELERGAQLERERAVLTETVRLFEESQIPMVPRAAQARLDRAEARAAAYEEALRQIGSSSDYGPGHLIARAALDAKLTEGE